MSAEMEAVEPDDQFVLDGMPKQPLPGEDREEREFETARNTISLALDRARGRLIELRAHRADVNAEIKLLVDETELLDRMWRIANGAKGSNHEEGAPQPEE